MKGPRQLTADIFECPYCKSDNVEVRQAGYFVNTLLLICYACQRAAIFQGPQVIWTKQLEKQEVRTDFRPEPDF